jgi:hypothetical protein
MNMAAWQPSKPLPLAADHAAMFPEAAPPGTGVSFAAPT